MSINYRLYKLKRRFGCQHPGSIVTADILDGDFHGGPGGEQQVEWCRKCGAYRRVSEPFGRKPHYGEWRIPSAWTAS